MGLTGVREKRTLRIVCARRAIALILLQPTKGSALIDSATLIVMELPRRHGSSLDSAGNAWSHGIVGVLAMPAQDDDYSNAPFVLPSSTTG